MRYRNPPRSQWTTGDTLLVGHGLLSTVTAACLRPTHTLEWALYISGLMGGGLLMLLGWGALLRRLRLSNERQQGIRTTVPMVLLVLHQSASPLLSLGHQLRGLSPVSLIEQLSWLTLGAPFLILSGAFAYLILPQLLVRTSATTPPLHLLQILQPPTPNMTNPPLHPITQILAIATAIPAWIIVGSNTFWLLVTTFVTPP